MLIVKEQAVEKHVILSQCAQNYGMAASGSHNNSNSLRGAPLA